MPMLLNIEHLFDVKTIISKKRIEKFPSEAINMFIYCSDVIKTITTDDVVEVYTLEKDFIQKQEYSFNEKIEILDLILRGSGFGYKLKECDDGYHLAHLSERIDPNRDLTEDLKAPLLIHGKAFRNLIIMSL